MHHIETADIPSAEQIKNLREQIGTQTKCANMAQVGLRTWQMWETGERSPSKAAWELFLLKSGQHPTHIITEKPVT